MYIVFYKTNDVFLAEEKINKLNIEVKIVPTPVQDKAYCGVCLKIDEKIFCVVQNVISEMDYIKIV